jgi:hypothetical protein
VIARAQNCRAATLRVAIPIAEIYMNYAPKHDAAQRLTEAFGEVASPSSLGELPATSC